MAVTHNDEDLKGYHRSLTMTEPDEIKDPVLHFKNKKIRKVRLDNTRQLHERSAKNKRLSTDDSTPRRPKNKSKYTEQAVQRTNTAKKNSKELKTLNDYDLPTVVTDYSSTYEDEHNKKQYKKTRKVHRPWHSPRKDTSDSETSLSGSSCTSPFVAGRGGVDGFPGSSSPIIVLPGDPTPSGLYGYTPLGFNGYLRCTYKCVYCSKVFETATTLYNHCNYHHYGDKPYECPFCKARFSYNIQYAEHLNNHILTKSFPTYKCGICSIGFSSQWELELHSATHTYVVQLQTY